MRISPSCYTAPGKKWQYKYTYQYINRSYYRWRL